MFKDISSLKIVSWVKKNKRVLILFFVVLIVLYLGVVKVIASTKMSYYGDESDDIAIVIKDLSSVKVFFNNVTSTDQARLQNLIALPFVLIFKYNTLLSLRILHIFLYFAYLFILYKLFSLKLSKVQAAYGIILVAFNAYMFSFSIFSASTSNTVANLLGTLLIYYYLDRFTTKNKPTLNNIILLGIIAGLAVGARFFNAIILVSIFVYDIYLNRNLVIKDFKLNFWQNILVRINCLFLFFLGVINLAPIRLTLKAPLAFLLVAFYIFFILYEYKKNIIKISEKKYLSFIEKWLALGTTSVVVSLIVSPIHLNFMNIYKLTKWSSLWHHNKNYINPSRFDIFTIIGIKLGVFVIVLTLLSIIFLIANKKLIQFLKDYALILLIIVLNLAIFVWVKFVIVWYPLFIMPFLYLPLIYVFPKDLIKIRQPLIAIMLGILFLVPIMEQVRYWKLFPFGHIDGAQYGEEYIGWNKPGMITFESMNYVAKYFKENEHYLDSGSIDCKVVRSDIIFSDWAPRLINLILSQQGASGFSCSNKYDELPSKYALTSVYTDSSSLAKINQDYKTIHLFNEAGVPFARLWVLKN